MKSSIHNEIKAQIIRAGYTIQEVVDQLYDECSFVVKCSINEDCSFYH